MTREEREEAILHMTLRREELKHSVGVLDEDIKAFDMAIKALEQEPMLDKVKAEIQALMKTYPFINQQDTYVKENDVMKIIEKYKVGKEDL